MRIFCLSVCLFAVFEFIALHYTGWFPLTQGPAEWTLAGPAFILMAAAGLIGISR